MTYTHQCHLIQVLTGCFPIAQLREPYSAIQYIAERVDLPGILKLQPPDGAGDTHKPWSAFDLCEGESQFLGTFEYF